MKSANVYQELNVLKRALRIAAMEAFKHEVIDLHVGDSVLQEAGTFPSEKEWRDKRIDEWITEAELG